MIASYVRRLFLKMRPTYGLSSIIGEYEFRSGEITGWVADEWNPDDRKIRIEAVERGRLVAVGETSVYAKGRGWGFRLEIPASISSQDLLNDRLVIRAVSAFGAATLKLDGASQLQMIREAIDRPFLSHIDIDFSERGNSNQYIRSGWLPQEPSFRWTTGQESSLDCALQDLPETSPRLHCQMTVAPLICFKNHPSQDMEVTVNNEFCWRMGINTPNFRFFEFPINFEITNRPANLHFRFLHRDSATPCKLWGGEDSRDLAFAFKRLKVVSYRD